jgi:hypothetical protein
LTAAGVVELRSPLSLAKLLRLRSQEGDIRLSYAEAIERHPWKGRVIGVVAIMWGLLFIVLMTIMLMNPAALS